MPDSPTLKGAAESGSDAPICSLSSLTPETDEMDRTKFDRDPNRVIYFTAYMDMLAHAAHLERQRNIAVAALQDLAARYGHKSDPLCGCEDCSHIRPIETAISAATSPANADVDTRPSATPNQQ